MTNNNNPEKNPNQITIELDAKDLGITNVGLGADDFMKENVIGMPAGYNPQDYMAKKQGNWTALGIGLANAATGTLGEIVSIPGYLYEMLESTWNDVNTWENQFINMGDAISDLKLGEVYQSRKSEAKWFAFADGEWWGKTAEQWGPTIAMMVASMGGAALTSKLLAKLSKLSKYLKAGDIAKAGQAAKNLRVANTINAAVQNRLLEGSMEAYESFQSTYEVLKEQNPNASEDELRKVAGDAAASTFMNNLPLAVLDVLQFDLLLNGLSKYGLGGKFLKGATGAAIEVGTEGFEEGYQYAISNVAQQNAEAKMSGEDRKSYVISELTNALMSSDPELWKSMGQGMAGGVVFTSMGQLASRITGLKKVNDDLKKYVPTGNVADQSRINEEILLASIKSHYEHGDLERVIMQADAVINDPEASDEDKQRSELISKLAKKYQSDQDKIPEGPARDEQIDMLFRKAVAENDAENILAELTAAENDMAGFYPSPTMENQSYNKLLIRKAVLEGLSYKEKEFEDSRKALLKDVNESLKNMQGEQINTPYDQGLKQGYEHYYTRLIDSHATQKKATELSNPDSIVHVERERKLGVIRGEFEAAKTPDELNKAYEGYVGDEHFRYIREAREEIHNKKADAEVQGAVEPNDPDKMKDFYQDKPFAYRRRFPTAPWPIEAEATETKGPEGNPPTDYINLALNGEGKAGSRAANLLTWEDDSKYAEHGRRLSDLELVALIDRGLVNSNLGNLIAVSGKMPDSLQDKVDASMAGITNRKISEKTVKQWEKLSDAKKIEVYNGLGLDLDKNAKQKEVDFAELLEEERQAKEAAKLDDYNNSLVPDGANLDVHTEETPINYNEGNSKAEQFIESYDVATFVRVKDSIELHRHEIEINGKKKTMLTRKEFMEHFKPIDPQGEGRFDAMPEDKTLVLYNKDGTPVESSFAKSMGIDRDFIRHGKIVVGEKRVGFRVDNTLEGIKEFNKGKVSANTFNVQVVYYDDNNKPHVIGVLKSTNETTRAGYVGLKELRKKLWAEYQKSNKTGVVEFTPKTSIDYVHRGTFNTTKNPNSRMPVNQLLQKGMPLLFGVGMFINETYVLDVNADAMPDGENKEMALEMTSAWSTPGNLYMGVKDRFGKVVPFRVFIKSIKKLPEHRWKLLQAIANFDVYSARELVRFRDKYKNNIRPDFNQDLEKHYSDNKISRQKNWTGKFGLDDFLRPGALLNVEGQTVELLKLNKDKTWQVRTWEAVENPDGTTNRLGKSTQNDNFDLETPMASGKVFAHYAYQYYMSFNLDDHQAQVDVRQINTENYNNEVAPLLEVDGVPGELFHSPGFALNLNQKNEPVAKKNIQAKKGKDGKFRKVKTTAQTSTEGTPTFTAMKKDGDRLAITKDKQFYQDKEGKKYSRVSNFYKPGNKKNEEGLYGNLEDITNPIVQASVKWGTRLDNFVRDWFLNTGSDRGELVDALVKEIGNPELSGIDNFISDMEALEEWFKSRGETVFTEELILSDDETRVAGTVDIITVDKQGNWRIYDLKTMRTNYYQSGTYDKVYTGPNNDGLSYKGRHLRQLSTYRMLLAKRHGIHAVEVGIIPIAIFYHEEGTKLESINFGNLRGFSDEGVRVEELDPNRGAKAKTTPGVVFFEPLNKIKELEMPTTTGDSFLDAAEEFSQTKGDRTVDMNDRQRVVLNKAGIAYKAQHKTGDTWKDYVANSSVQKRLIHAHTINKKLMQVGAANATLILLDGSEVRANPIMAGGFDITQGVMDMDGNPVDYSAIKDVKPVNSEYSKINPTSTESTTADIERRRQEELEKKLNTRYTREKDFEKNLAPNQEIGDNSRIGHEYSEGDKVTANFENHTSENFEAQPYRMVIKVKKPTILTDGKMTQSGEVVVGLFESKEAAENWLKNDKNKAENLLRKKAQEINAKYDAEYSNKPTSPVQIISLPNFLYDKIAVVVQGEKRKFVLEYSPLSKKKLDLYPEVKEDGSYTSGGTFPTEADARKLEAKYIPKKLLNKLRKWESKVANAKNAEEAKAEWEELSTFANESFKVEIQAPDLEYTHTDKVIPSFSDVKPFEMAVPTSYGPSGVDVGITMTFESQLQALQYFKSYYSEEPLDFDSEGNMLETNHNSTIANKILQTNDPKELMELGSQYKGFDEKRWFTEENSIREAVYKAANPDLQQEETEIKKGDTVKTAWDDVEYEVTDVKENEVSLKKTVADKSTNIDTSVDKLAGTEQDTPTKKPKKRRGLAALKKNAEKRKLEAKENDLNVNDDNPLNDDCNKV